jgi:hypothetical protein
VKNRLGRWRRQGWVRHFQLHSSPKSHQSSLARKYAGLRRTNRRHGDSGHSCRGENREISGRAQVNCRGSGGVGAVRDGLQVKFVRDGSDKEWRKHWPKGRGRWLRWLTTWLLEVEDWGVHWDGGENSRDCPNIFVAKVARGRKT